MRSPNEYEQKIAEKIFDFIDCEEGFLDFEVEFGDVYISVICSFAVSEDYDAETNSSHVYCDWFSIDNLKITEYDDGDEIETKAEVRADIIEVLVTDMFDAPFWMKRRRA